MPVKRDIIDGRWVDYANFYCMWRRGLPVCEFISNIQTQLVFSAISPARAVMNVFRLRVTMRMWRPGAVVCRL